VRSRPPVRSVPLAPTGSARFAPPLSGSRSTSDRPDGRGTRRRAGRRRPLPRCPFPARGERTPTPALCPRARRRVAEPYRRRRRGTRRPDEKGTPFPADRRSEPTIVPWAPNLFGFGRRRNFLDLRRGGGSRERTRASPRRPGGASPKRARGSSPSLVEPYARPFSTARPRRPFGAGSSLSSRLIRLSRLEEGEERGGNTPSSRSAVAIAVSSPLPRLAVGPAARARPRAEARALSPVPLDSCLPVDERSFERRTSALSPEDLLPGVDGGGPIEARIQANRM